MSDTTHLGLPLLEAAQAQKHVTHNEALILLDHMIHLAVISRALATPPSTPAEGDRYLIATSAAGDWSGHDGDIAFYQDGVWRFLEPKSGWRLWSIGEEKFLLYDGTDWRDLQAPEELQNLLLLGVDTTADATNKLAVRSNALLLTALAAADGGTGNAQAKLNKETSGDTASLLFQTGFSGRAEFGLAGDDDFHVRVSPDGSAWADAFSVDRNTGRTTFALSPGRLALDTFTANGTYAVPAWAKRLHIACIGGGGGGGSGASGSNASNRWGGGGGGAGGRSEEDFDVAELASSLSIAIGAGGTGPAGVTGNTSGSNGGNGGDTTVSSSGTVILVGGGGGGGGAGGTTAGTAGAQGNGNRLSNPGGASAVAANGSAGPLTQADNAGGGGGAGGLPTAGTERAGGDGGYGYFIGGPTRRADRGVGATTPGAASGNGPNKGWARGLGAGGGGGCASVSGNGGAGGTGGAPAGGGGGGGAACRDTATSGAGGTGGRGEVWIIASG